MKLLMRKFAVTLCLIAISTLAQAQTDSISVQDPWVREAPPMANVLAAFMLIENDATMNRKIVAARSPAFKRVEMHKTEVKDGVANMLRQDAVEIPAGGSLAFKPGSYHFMLIGPLKPVKAGDSIPLTLSFANGDQLEVIALVRKAVDAMDDMKGMQGMENMQGMEKPDSMPTN